MKKSFLTSVSGFLVAGIVSANAGFAEGDTAEIDTKNENSQDLLEKMANLVDDESFTESLINASVNKNQKIKGSNENSDKKSKKNNEKENLTNSKKNENPDKKSKKDNTKENLPKLSKKENSNKTEESFFSIFKRLKTIKASFAGVLAFAGFSATSIALTAETVGLSKIGTKLGVEKDTANFITIGTGVAATVLVIAEFLMKS